VLCVVMISVNKQQHYQKMQSSRDQIPLSPTAASSSTSTRSPYQHRPDQRKHSRNPSNGDIKRMHVLKVRTPSLCFLGDIEISPLGSPTSTLLPTDPSVSHNISPPSSAPSSPSSSRSSPFSRHSRQKNQSTEFQTLDGIFSKKLSALTDHIREASSSLQERAGLSVDTSEWPSPNKFLQSPKQLLRRFSALSMNRNSTSYSESDELSSQELPEDVKALEEALSHSVARENLINQLLAAHSEGVREIRFVTGVGEFQRCLNKQEKYLKGRKLVEIFINESSNFRLKNSDRLISPQIRQESGSSFMHRMEPALIALKLLILGELLKLRLISEWLSDRTNTEDRLELEDDDDDNSVVIPVQPMETLLAADMTMMGLQQRQQPKRVVGLT
jgi:hypothetical protein